MTQYEKLTALRKEHGLSQLTVAERLGVSRQSVSRWESGKARPSPENIRELAALYGVPTDYLLYEDKSLPEEADGPMLEEHAEEQKRRSIRSARRVILTALVAVLLAALVTFAWWYYEEGRWPEVHTEKIDMGEVNWESFAFYWP